MLNSSPAIRPFSCSCEATVHSVRRFLSIHSIIQLYIAPDSSSLLSNIKGYREYQPRNGYVRLELLFTLYVFGFAPNQLKSFTIPR